MKIALGLPSCLPSTSATLMKRWAMLAEDGPFSSLCAIDRLVYPNHDPLMALAVVAGVTRRIRLMTTVLIAPLHNAGVLAKQAASLDVLSDGRLTLGLGVGGREDDFRAAPASFHDRGKRFEQQLELMTRIWSGQPVDDETGPIGPTPVQPGGPEVLFGGNSLAALNRLKRWGNGFLAGAWSREQTNQSFRQVEEIWKQNGRSRSGKPRLVCSTYYGLGPDAAKYVEAFMLDYYAFASDAIAVERARSVPTTTQAIQALIQEFAAIGTDELIFWPCIPDLNQVTLLAKLVGQE
jgi:alkanesulfonate monooxygenase SsuD/methylene tetrahydromethanopterin reductase-like flavin-dependent oxidoreductase (luciferase family)